MSGMRGKWSVAEMKKIVIVLIFLGIAGCDYKDSNRELVMVSIEVGYTAHAKGWTLQETENYVDKRMGWSK